MKLLSQNHKTLFLALIVCFLVFPFSAKAAENWTVLGNTGWVSGDNRLTLEMPFVSHPELRITSDSEGNFLWVEMQIPFTLGATIKGIYLCYKTPNEGTFISQIRLAEYLIPGTATVHHDDGTDLVSPDGTCYFSAVSNYSPAGSVNLSLRLNFANAGERIDLGALGILIEQ